MIAAAAAPDALAALGAEGGARDLAAVQGRLARRFGPPAAMPAGIDPMRRREFGGRPGRGAAPASRARQGHRRVHGAPRRAADFTADISPPRADRDNAQSDEPHLDRRGRLRRAFFPVSPPVAGRRSGRCCSCAHSILDGCDGELARLKFQESRWGGILDFWGDNVVHSVIFAVHGGRLELVCRRGMAAMARGLRRFSAHWDRPASSIGG